MVTYVSRINSGLFKYFQAVRSEADSSSKQVSTNNINVWKATPYLYQNPGYSCPAYINIPSPDYVNPSFQAYDNPPPYDPDGTNLKSAALPNEQNEQTNVDSPILQNPTSQQVTHDSCISSLNEILKSPGTSV